MHRRLEEECPGSKKLKIRLQSEVNLITFNSSQFPGSSLHCHLGRVTSHQTLLLPYTLYMTFRRK